MPAPRQAAYKRRRANGRIVLYVELHRAQLEAIFGAYGMVGANPTKGELTQAFTKWATIELKCIEAELWPLGDAHVHTFNYLGGAARQTISDNLKAGITKACFFEPLVNRTYGDLARHYGTAIIPAQPRKARDKAKVEVGVQVVERWILARLRKQRFFSLAELNAAIRELLDELNARPLRGFGMSRRELFEQIERPAPILTSFSRSGVATKCSTSVGRADVGTDWPGYSLPQPPRIEAPFLVRRILSRL